MAEGTARVAGIEAINAYCGMASLEVRDLLRGRGLDEGRIGNLMMSRRSVALPFEDPVTNAVNAAKPIVDRLSEAERSRIEMLVTSSESGVDYSKSIASYAHEYLGLSRNCRFVETKQACYGATAAIQLAIGYAASGISPGAKVLVVGTDITLINDKGGYAEPAMGAGGVAVLVSDKPRVLRVDLGAFGNYSYDVMDTARPSPEFDFGHVDQSLFTYLDCLSNSFSNYAERVEGADFVATFDYLAMHTPFAGLVKAGHRKIMRELRDADPDEIAKDFQLRVSPSLVYPSQVGNLCSGSVYLALASLIDTVRPTKDQRVGIYSYGSGCASEFYSGVMGPESTLAMREVDIAGQLESRVPVSFERYQSMLDENFRAIVPVRDRELAVEPYHDIVRASRVRRPLLALSRIENFHRKYVWI